MYSTLYSCSGLGDPDITAGDGVYSAYLPRYSTRPGYYAVRLTVTDNGGLATVPKLQSRGE